MSESAIRRADLPPTQYVCGIPFYPVGGTVFLYGAPGVGKSFVTQGLNHTVAWGKPLPGFTSDHTANVLYCDFEGTAAMVQERSFALTPHGQLASDNGGADMPTDITYVFYDQWRGKTFTERLAELEGRLIAQESHGIGHSLVVLDTFQAFIGSKPIDANAYEYDRECIEALNRVADRCQVCILLIHHPNKAGEMSGSTGRAGTAWIVLRFRKVADGQAVLSMDKNRVGIELDFAFDWDRNRVWRLSTDMPARVAVAKGNNRAILAALTTHGPCTKAELLAHTGMTENSLKSGLQRLRWRGDVELLEDDGRWRATFSVQPMPSMPVFKPWENCPSCNCVVDGELGCVNVRCERYRPRPGETEAGIRRDPAPDDTPPPPTAPAPAQGPRWKQMGNANRGSKTVEPPKIDASSRMVEGEKVWTTSPITAAVDLIMADRDAGRLGPTWRCELPAEISAQAIDGQHHWGMVPQRRNGEYIKEPTGEWCSYDVRGSFLAAYKTPCMIKPPPAPILSDGSDWTSDSAGALEVKTPEWSHPGIGHPCGSKARPGEWQWIWSPTYRNLRRLADAGVLPAPQVRRSSLRRGYQEASEALFAGFYDRMKAGREAYQGEEQEYIKEMYSAWLSSARIGKSNVFKRGDWWYGIRSEAFGRQWWAGYGAVTQGVQLLGMGNTDELVFRPHPKLAQLFPQDDRRIGKLVIKGHGDGLPR